MDKFVDIGALQPLLDVARNDSHDRLRVAALDAVCRFRLAEPGWQEVASVTRPLVFDLPANTPTRKAALKIATQIPLLSVRQQLRKMADDPDEPDAAALASALADVGDPHQVGTVFDEIRAGHFGRLEALATMALEQSGVAAADLPPVPADLDPEARMWRALSLARLGEFAELDAFLDGSEDEPPMFWGDPWSLYERIAAMRPVPDILQQRLLHALPAAERLGDSEKSRMAKLIIWAATGVADAEGNAISEPEVTAPEPAVAAAPSAADFAAATAAAHRIKKHFSGRIIPQILPAQEDLSAIRCLQDNEVKELVASIVKQADEKVRWVQTDGPVNEMLGNTIISVVENLPPQAEMPVEELAASYVADAPGALDNEQLAWVIAHGSSATVTERLAPQLHSDVPFKMRIKTIGLLGAIADVQSGRAGSPWRGFGGGGGGMPRIDLIDDQPRAAMISAPQKKMVVRRAAPIEEAPKDEPDEERRINAHVIHEGQRRKTFVAGGHNIIRCWIGPEEKDVAASDAAIPGGPLPKEGLPLTVQLLWNDQSDSKPMNLPARRSARSGDCDLSIKVPADQRHIKANIAFLYRGRLFEMVTIEAAVLEKDDVERERDQLLIKTQVDRRQVIDLTDRPVYGSTFVWGGADEDGDADGASSLLEFGASGAARYSLSNASEAIKWLNTQLFNTTKSLVRQQEDDEASGEQVLDAKNEEVLDILRQLARHGAELYNQLKGQRLSDPDERIQLLNRSPDEYVPLEFVYDAGYPAADATLCDGWQEALNGDADSCPACTPGQELTDEERDLRSVICPLGFWSLQKVIERLDPQHALEHGEGQSAPAPGHRTLAKFDRVVFGASHRVEAVDRQATIDALKQSVDHVDVAENWTEWRIAIKNNNTPLLLALPHHGAQDNEDFLEIGGKPTEEQERRLARGRLSNLYVNPQRLEPGPVVVLLGCLTDDSRDTGYVSLARRLQQLRTAIVIGTLAKILGRHAAPVAQELVSQLTATHDGDTDFGTIMRRVRRRMLGRGYLMALCLVSLGDADWHLGGSSQSTEKV